MKRNLSLIYLFNFLIDLRFYAPVAILYFADVAGSYALGMSIFSIVFLSQAVAEIPTGLYSDRIGRKKTIISGTLFSVAAIGLYATGAGYLWLACGAVLEGIARSFFSGTISAFLYETLNSLGKKEEFSEYKGKTTSMHQLAMLVAAAAGGLIAGIFSLQTAVLVSLVPLSLCACLCLFFVEPPIHKKTEHNVLGDLKVSLTYFAKNRKLRLISLANIISYGFGQASHQFEAVFFKSLLPLWLIGFVKMAGYACSGLSFWFSGKFIKMFGHYKVLVTAHGLLAVFGTIFVSLNSIISPFVLALTSIGQGAKFVASADLMNKEFSDAQRATMGSFVSLFGSICFAIASLILGWIADISSPLNALFLGLSINIVPIILYRHVFSKHS